MTTDAAQLEINRNKISSRDARDLLKCEHRLPSQSLVTVCVQGEDYSAMRHLRPLPSCSLSRPRPKVSLKSVTTKAAAP
jgi:hypothetical protein